MARKSNVRKNDELEQLVQDIETVNEPETVETVEEKSGKRAKDPARTITKEEQKELDELKSVSAQIRYLDKQGWTRSQIAQGLGKRYQHVRNVLTTELKKGNDKK